MRLIDADVLIGKVFKNDISYNAFKSLVKREPTVDAVPVVRCKDCKEYISRWNGDYICGRIGSYYGNTKPDDFCSYGERSEENG